MPYDASDGDISRFLHIIEQLESSSGQNMNHPTMQSGIHAGDAAQGRYGVMPNTVDEFQSRSMASDLTPDDAAALVAHHVLNKTGGDEGLAASMYQFGHNKDVSNPDVVNQLQSTPRYQNYNNLRYEQVPLAIDPNPYGSRLDEMNDQMGDENNTLLNKKMITFPNVKNLVSR